MYERMPRAKWFGVVGDDVFVDPDALTATLSAFDPDEEWCATTTERAPVPAT